MKTATKPTKPLKPLTRKQAAFVKHLVDNPKQSATEAAAQIYDVERRATAEVIAYENLRKPQILAELAKYDNTAQNTLVEVMNYSREYGAKDTKQGASYASTAANIANSLLDRLHGKAKQSVEHSGTVVKISLDLTSKQQ